MRVVRTIVLAGLLGVLAPTAARADGMFTPFIGANFGGSSGKELLDAIEAKRTTWGLNVAYMGGGVFGIEADWAYSPDFFGKTDVGGSSVSTFMGNLLIGAPFGGQKGFGVRPYGLVGAGIVHPSGEAFTNLLDFSENKIGWDIGGGVMIFFASHVGMRGDLRYIRTFEKADFLNEPGDLDFARGSVGLILRW